MSRKSLRDQLLEILEDVSGKHLDSGELSTHADIIISLTHIDSDQLPVDKTVLEDCLVAVKKLKDIISKISPQYTDDVILVNDLNTLEYRLEDKLFNNK